MKKYLRSALVQGSDRNELIHDPHARLADAFKRYSKFTHQQLLTRYILQS